MIRYHPALEDLLVDIDSVGQHPQNPNNGDTDAIAESIQVNGYYNPVIVQTSTNRIIVGNHRYAALLELGETRIPAIHLDIDDEAALRIMLADNRTTRLGRDDPALLLELLTALKASDLELLGTGYDADHIAKLAAIPDQRLRPELGDLIHTCPACGHTWTNR